MPRLTNLTPNLGAFLDMIARAEIGPQMLAAPCSDDGYRVLVGSTPDCIWVFFPYDDHPFMHKRPIQYAKGVYSSAAGRYQIMSKWWPHYKKQLQLPDFSPESQDLYAIQQIKEQRAYQDVLAGSIHRAIEKCSNIWASLPGAGYGQHEHKVDTLLAAYEAAGGKVA